MNKIKSIISRISRWYLPAALLTFFLGYLITPKSDESLPEIVELTQLQQKTHEWKQTPASIPPVQQSSEAEWEQWIRDTQAQRCIVLPHLCRNEFDLTNPNEIWRLYFTTGDEKFARMAMAKSAIKTSLPVPK